ncbi:hypothetical protein V2S66_11270 [Streptomyces sp. V4-01]|uniref:Small CPxCG-related zinc finger protein n=1 Tax=Actinacidiphila polyblastidii TaxID=3110430 RepID=A0ABU7P9Q2_9ACTN|nr:hypothetical protein [Streptomyces sp. V4-01]
MTANAPGNGNRLQDGHLGEDREGRQDAAGGGRAGEPAAPVADCVLCSEPTEHPASTRGATLCPVCEWQEAQRTACSG